MGVADGFVMQLDDSVPESDSGVVVKTALPCLRLHAHLLHDPDECQEVADAWPPAHGMHTLLAIPHQALAGEHLAHVLQQVVTKYMCPCSSMLALTN